MYFRLRQSVSKKTVFRIRAADNSELLNREKTEDIWNEGVLWRAFPYSVDEVDLNTHPHIL